MKLSHEKLLQEAQATDFRPDMIEKVIQLVGLLQSLRSHPYLKERIALKGGTALNLFAFDLPRLSVDIDLNYIGSADLETMKAERPKLEEAVGAVLSREGFAARRIPNRHAGGKWVLTFPSALGQTGTLELDLNFMFRVPLWPISIQDSCAVGSYQALKIPVVDRHELAGGKLAALVSRRASRDLFDAREVFKGLKLDDQRLRIAFVIFGAMNLKDCRTVSIRDIDFDLRELERQLLPLLRGKVAEKLVSPAKWAEQLVEECRSAMSALLPLRENEQEFLNRLLEQGKAAPELLTDDSQLADRIRSHPNLQWQTEKLRKFGKKK